MCGFAGVVAFHDKYRTSDETLRRMSAAIAHRGPDGEGYYINHRDEVTPDRPQVALAFRRLAILDPDPRSNQPFTDGRHWLVFNGEIYNFRELRKELTQLEPSYEWRTTGDTEVLLRSYAIWRDKCVEHLNGMFAFAVWDERDKALFLARDHAGQKPLHFGIAPEKQAIVFGSEISALLPVPWFRGKIEWESIAQYLRWGYVPPARTVYEGIYKLPTSHRMNCRYGLLEQPHRYRLPYESVVRGHEWSISGEGIRSMVREAVRKQLVADVPLGCLLSGGIDSSVVAASMALVIEKGQRVMTFSIGFDDSRFDETRYAREVAKYLGADHHAFQVKPNAAEDLPALCRVFGEPFADSSALPTHYLARETRQHVKVALSGDGGDEMFGGYDRYRAMTFGERLRRLPKPLPQVMSSDVWQRLPGSHPKSRVTRMKRFLATLDLDKAQRYAAYVRLFSEEVLAELMLEPPDPSQFGPDQIYERLVREHHDDALATAMETDRWSYLPEDLHTKVDRASMLHALEVRAPFMDPSILEFAYCARWKGILKLYPNKTLLRMAFRDYLPDFVFKRRKMGFAVPIGEWFRGELRPMLRDHLFAADSFARGHFNMGVVERLIDEHESQRVDHSQRLYALLMLELWWRQSRCAP